MWWVQKNSTYNVLLYKFMKCGYYLDQPKIPENSAHNAPSPCKKSSCPGERPAARWYPTNISPNDSSTGKNYRGATIEGRSDYFCTVGLDHFARLGLAGEPANLLRRKHVPAKPPGAFVVRNLCLLRLFPVLHFRFKSLANSEAPQFYPSAPSLHGVFEICDWSCCSIGAVQIPSKFPQARGICSQLHQNGPRSFRLYYKWKLLGRSHLEASLG